jgi:hypothetical protein
MKVLGIFSISKNSENDKPNLRRIFVSSVPSPMVLRSTTEDVGHWKREKFLGDGEE